MTLATNGDFDQSVELSEELLTAAAAATLAVDTQPSNVPAGLPVTGSVRTSVTLERIWFRKRPPQWVTDSGFPNLTRNTSDVVTLALRIDVRIEIQSVQVDFNNTTYTVDTSDPRYNEFRYIDFPAFVEVSDHVEVQTLAVTRDREAPGVTATVPVVVIDFNHEAGIPRDWPRVDVKIKRSDLQANLAVMALMAAAVVKAGGSGAAGDAALTDLLTTITATIPPQVTLILQSMTTWQLEAAQDAGKTMLYAELDPAAPAPVNLAVKTLEGSLFIGIDYIASRGRTGNVTRSTRRTRRVSGAGVADDFAVTVSNRWLLRGIIRGTLAKLFQRAGPPPTDLVLTRITPPGGLPPIPSDFRTDEFCMLRAPVDGVKFGTDIIKLETLFAFINNSSQVEILFSFSNVPTPGATAHATLDLKLSFDVKRQVVGSKQTLVLAINLDNPDTAVTGKRVDVEWWLYAIGFVVPVLPILGAGAVALVDVGLDDLLGGKLNQAISALSISSKDQAAALPLTLEAPVVELMDTDAPPMPTPMGSALASIAGGHDLYLGARFSRLPRKLTVRFVVPDSNDVGSRLDGIGGNLTGGREWVLPIDDAIAMIDAGQIFVVKAGGKSVRVITAIKKGKVPYLRTEKDDLGVNNLGNLPKRIPAAGALGPTP